LRGGGEEGDGGADDGGSAHGGYDDGLDGPQGSALDRAVEIVRDVLC
jgi:hypothetical protein